MCINSNAVITISHENIINQYLIATHQINAVAPSFTTERFQVLDGQAGGFTSENRIMIGIYNGYSINQYIFRISYFNAA